MDAFVWYLQSLNRDDRRRDNAALAALRRGLSYPPGEYAGMFSYVLPHLSEEQQKFHFSTYCLLASLYAYHPMNTDQGNLGNHMRQAGREADNPKGVSEATERRFISLLRVHPLDLPGYLRQAVSFMKSKKEVVPVHWDQLLQDLIQWEFDPEPVRKSWARGFWGFKKRKIKTNKTNIHLLRRRNNHDHKDRVPSAAELPAG